MWWVYLKEMECLLRDKRTILAKHLDSFGVRGLVYYISLSMLLCRLH